jgi:3-oxoacyl-[acyl-carrier-protein] synthase-3
MAKRAGIVGLGYYVPERVLTNKDLEKMVDTTDEWIRSRTGIQERHIAEKGLGTSEMAAKAALAALANAKIKPEEIDLIIVGTFSPDMTLPSCACLVQKKIGATNAMAFDLVAACAGFLFSLSTAEQYILNGTFKTVLVIGAEMISSYVDWTDRTTCVLFGDGAGAAILRETDSGGILASVLGSDGQYSDLLKIPSGGSQDPATAQTVSTRGHFVQMSGSEVFKLAVRLMTDTTVKVLAKAGIQAQEVSCFIPHQANLRIIDAVADRLKLPKEKIFINVQKYGNTSAASIAIALCEAVAAGRIKKKDKIVFATFGAGLVWGAMALEW